MSARWRELIVGSVAADHDTSGWRVHAIGRMACSVGRPDGAHFHVAGRPDNLRLVLQIERDHVCKIGWAAREARLVLGTALGDWVADAGLGYEGGALLFGAGLAVLAILYFSTRVSHVALFWAAFILTRPLGATVGDFLDKPIAHGGLEFSRPVASAVIAVAIVALILILPQRAGRHPGQAEVAA